MHFLLKSLFYCLLFFVHAALIAQAVSPKREVRAVWISTVENIDWPANSQMRRKEQKKQLLQLLDSMKALGINTVFIQVRPASDAFYRSRKEPWSEWLRGAQGKGAGYDPLKFIVAACHERALEVHAWFNPFRAIHGDKQGRSMNAKHVSEQHPEWIVPYGKGAVINPGIPEARMYIVSVIEDVVKRYDIDGIHLDDYFYPYPYKSRVFPDSVEYKRYGGGFNDIGDWRRDNINQLIQSLCQKIQQEKPYVKFGISPFGVWRNSYTDAEGSNTWASIPSYDSIYADTRLWLKKGWIDYVVPQIYWSMNFKAAPFRELLPWWAKNSYGRHVYAGHAVYKINNNHDSNWDNPSEIPNQIRMVRDFRPQSLGSAFFRAGFLLQNPGGIKDSLKVLYKHPALLPTMPWKGKGKSLFPPKNIKFSKGQLQWQAAGSQPAYYAIYRHRPQENFNPNNSSQLIAIVSGKVHAYVDQEGQEDSYQYRISAINRYWEEFLPE